MINNHMETFLSYVEAEHFWTFMTVIISSWVIMYPIKKIFVKHFKTTDHIFFFVTCYLIAAALIFFVWPGDTMSSAIAATLLGFLVPKIHKIGVTAIGKKWAWARTIITGERKTYEEDELTGDDVTVWLNQTQVQEHIEELNKKKSDEPQTGGSPPTKK